MGAYHVPETGRCVYFARRPSDGLIKIGTTQHVFNRLTQIRYASKDKSSLALLGVLPGGYRTEQRLLARFTAHHVGHEWHRPATELVEFIEREARVLVERAP